MNIEKNTNLNAIRLKIREHNLADEGMCVDNLIASVDLDDATRKAISKAGAELVDDVRDNSDPSIMEGFLAEYGLSSKEGVSLMCLAEALMRVPDVETMDTLIADKIVPSDWGQHLGRASSSLINAATWGLMLTGRILDDESEGIGSILRGMIKNLGEPVVRQAVSQAMREMGRQFVLGRTIEEALGRAKKYESEGYSYSYDMLGEAAMTEKDAKEFHLSYSDAITAISKNCTENIRENPGISVKLSALYSRYEMAQREDVMTELMPRVRSLALLAKSANMGFNIDAEEADRLDLSLDIIEATFKEPALANWDGFGVVVQAYGKRAPFVLDWLHALAEKYDRKIMVRLVKGAYWDSEIKRAQELGLDGFSVFTRKENTDVSYIACAKKLLDYSDRIYPQFATHNAHTVASILTLAEPHHSYEFQRLHGMGESLYEKVVKRFSKPCRIYAPVGAHRDLLAYLVRRLLENGANSSFVNQIVDESIPATVVASDPFEKIANNEMPNHPKIIASKDLYGASRINSKGFDITNLDDLKFIENGMEKFKTKTWNFASNFSDENTVKILNPCDQDQAIGTVKFASEEEINNSLIIAKKVQTEWADKSVKERAKILNKAADLYEDNFGELFVLLQKEAGKTFNDLVGEIREAVDFLRYYANQSTSINFDEKEARGVIACISPWNFPLAIFTGQISAALAAGNAVIAKPAEQTPLIAHVAIDLLHKAGVPKDILQLAIGDGMIGAALVCNPLIDGVCFTGSTKVAQNINQAMAKHLEPDAMLIAETGGLNAMIVDSTALPEQAVRDILTSSFQSAGQRCSALRILYLQEDIADTVLAMLYGAMNNLKIGDPKYLATDIGPVIDSQAQYHIESYCDTATQEGRLLKKLDSPEDGCFIAPHVIHVDGIEDMQSEIFGPILHVARFRAFELPQVLDQINAKNYGLTFGLHTRVDGRVQEIVDQIKVGNIYVNRNQIGAIVGTQPFGGEGLSGTGPKAGGSHYLPRFLKIKAPASHFDNAQSTNNEISLQNIYDAFAKLAPAINSSISEDHLPGPTGEGNRLSLFPRGDVLCLGQNIKLLSPLIETALKAGNRVVAIVGDPVSADADVKNHSHLMVIEGTLDFKFLRDIKEIAAVATIDSKEKLKEMRMALADNNGEIIPFITEPNFQQFVIERHLCVDHTASGGNASLLADVG